jgi:hypothetical protein
LCSVLLQRQTSRILRNFGLRYGDIKLLQAATGSVISGSTITALVHQPFIPNDIDFYCHYRVSTNVVRFIEDVGDLQFHEYTGHEYIDVSGIKGVWTLRGATGRKINIIETLASNPAKCIAGGFHSSAPRGMLEWDGLVHFEINQVRQGRALITRDSLHLDEPEDLSQQIACWNILNKYKARGFEFVFDYELPHVCGTHVNCPATVRSTADKYCLRVPLPPVDGIPVYSRTIHVPITWSPRGSTCATGMVDGLGKLHPATGFQGTPMDVFYLLLLTSILCIDKVYRAIITALLTRDTAPTNSLEINLFGCSQYADSPGTLEYASGMGPSSEYDYESDPDSEWAAPV